MKKLFAGIHEVGFNKDCTQIHEIKSFAKESVKLIDTVTVEEAVENWLNELTIGM